MFQKTTREGLLWLRLGQDLPTKSEAMDFSMVGWSMLKLFNDSLEGNQLLWWKTKSMHAYIFGSGSKSASGTFLEIFCKALAGCSQGCRVFDPSHVWKLTKQHVYTWNFHFWLGPWGMIIYMFFFCQVLTSSRPKALLQPSLLWPVGEPLQLHWILQRDFLGAHHWEYISNARWLESLA